MLPAGNQTSECPLEGACAHPTHTDPEWDFYARTDDTARTATRHAQCSGAHASTVRTELGATASGSGRLELRGTERPHLHLRRRLHVQRGRGEERHLRHIYPPSMQAQGERWVRPISGRVLSGFPVAGRPHLARRRRARAARSPCIPARRPVCELGRCNAWDGRRQGAAPHGAPQVA